ncbi:SprT-like protein [Mycobacterium phage Rebeuca]|uniref:SprT-like protein n=1 Tax=Mycobacterium phage Rebeuca TaxID=2927991 RepID=J7KKZ0_9CAUD|nr:SprT-like protein [Mycobacterium phage Rebeuca]AFQ97386.1 SprT-like protein [Mycobacterium phage Rebeuca]
MTAMLTRTMTITQARELTQDLLHEHGLKGWTVRFDNAKRRAGQCSYSTRTISLSRHLLALRSFEDSHNTITHEIAHALVGPGHGHNLVWVRKHRELGGDGKRCFESEGIDPTAPWVGTCSHGKQFARYRQPKRLEGWRCRCRQGSTPVVWEKRR